MPPPPKRSVPSEPAGDVIYTSEDKTEQLSTWKQNQETIKEKTDELEFLERDIKTASNALEFLNKKNFPWGGLGSKCCFK